MQVQPNVRPAGKGARFGRFAHLHGVQRQPQVALVDGVVSVFQQLLSDTEDTEMKAVRSVCAPPSILTFGARAYTLSRCRRVLPTHVSAAQKSHPGINQIVCVCARPAAAGTCVSGLSEIALRCL